MNTVPQRLDKYELMTLLGRGRVAEVWKALDTQLQRFVAIKVLRPNLREDPTFMARFLHEAQMVASLHHPNIVRVHDFQTWQRPSGETSIAYMVMDYIEGPTLAEYLHDTSEQGRFPSPSEVVNLFTSISLAVDYAHKQQMIHRDIKPENFLLDQHNTQRNPMGEPILTDFGIAKLVNAAATTQTGIHLGTPSYISPEQARGRQADARSDLYALGIILYQMMTGVLPFKGDTPLDVMAQHISAIPPAPSLLNSHISPALAQVMMRSLAKNGDDRFPSAAALTAAIAQAVAVPVPEVLSQTPLLDYQNMPTLDASQPSSPLPTPPVVPVTPIVPISTPSSVPLNPMLTPSLPAEQQEINATAASAQRVEPARTPILSAPPSAPHANVQHVPIASPFHQTPTRKRRNIFIVLTAAILALLLVAGLVTLPKIFSAPTPLTGQAFYVNSGNFNPGTAQGVADQLKIDLENVPDPHPGKSYHVWLLNDKVQVGGTDKTSYPPLHPPLLLTSNLAVRNGSAHYFFPGDAQHNNLLSVTSRLLITEEDTNTTPTIPSTDRSTWRYFAIIPQKPIPNDPTGLNAVNHIRHLFYDESRVNVLALPGGLDFWLQRNTEKVLEWSIAARDDWHGADTNDGQLGLMRGLFLTTLAYLDGNQNAHVDDATVDPATLNDPFAKISLLTVDPLRQTLQNSAVDPPGYIDHIQLHVSQVAAATDISPQMRERAAQILTEVKNAGGWLSNVRKDVVQLIQIENDPLQMRQTSTGQLLDDMVNQATYAYIGQLDPATNQVRPGVIQAHYDIQQLAVLQITDTLPQSL